MTSNAESGPLSGNGRVGASGPTPSLWLHLLKLSSIASALLFSRGANPPSSPTLVDSERSCKTFFSV